MEEIKITGEADANEVFAVQRELATGMEPKDEFLTLALAQKSNETLFRAIGYCLAKSQPLEDGSRRVEMHGGLIVRARLKPEHEGTAFGQAFTEPEHWDIDVKLHAGALRQIAEELGLQAKNG